MATQPFPFMDLPAELRELVYYHAFTPIEPIDTAAIPNTPDLIRIPPIAQLSQQTRKEALHVLSRSRPVEISLHSSENHRRALLWALQWHDHAAALPELVFSGRIANLQFHFFEITVRISDEQPHLTAQAKQFSSDKAMEWVWETRRVILARLSKELEDVQEGRQAKLSGGTLVELIEMVADRANKVDPKCVCR